MEVFEVYLGRERIGWSHLEFGDPPMGVVFGRLYVEPAGRVIDQGSAELRVLTAAGDVLRTENGGVAISDHREELEDDGAAELNVLGLCEEHYRSYFSHHIAAYEDRCRSR